MGDAEAATPPDAEKVRVPRVIRVTRLFLLFLVIVGSLGVVRAAYHLVSGVGSQETSAELRADVQVLLERSVLAAAAAVSLWAIGRRKPLGRWLTVGLGAFT